MGIETPNDVLGSCSCYLHCTLNLYSNLVLSLLPKFHHFLEDLIHNNLVLEFLMNFIRDGNPRMINGISITSQMMKAVYEFLTFNSKNKSK